MNPPSAHWILTDARIWPGGPPSAPRPNDRRATAMALRDGRVLAVGQEDEILELKGRDTAVFSMQGRFIMPGFVDPHVHLMVGGLQLFRVALRGVTTRQEFMQRVGDRTRTTPPGEWILGGGWNQEDWGGGFPTREWLDPVTPDHPVFLERMDLHMGVANSLALEMAGIDTETQAPDDGEIERDPDTGEPTGLLRERAMLLMSEAIPSLTDIQRREAVRAGALAVLAQGVTQVHDMGAVQRTEESWHSFEMLRELEEAGRLPLRVRAGLPVQDWRRVADLVKEEGTGEGFVRWGMLKGFVDGSFGSSTAWFHEPYLDRGSYRGGPICALDELEKDLRDAVAAGLQPAVHAIGDRANDWLLKLYLELRRAHPTGDLRLRMEHAQHLSREALEGLGSERMIVSAQPLHILDDAPSVRPKLGPDRESRAFALGTLHRSGCRLALGSDWPVAALDPLGSVWAAVTRTIPSHGDGAPPWMPDEVLDLETALRAHTWGGAVAGGAEGETGSLEPGKRADFVVLSSDPFDVPPRDLCDATQVDMTFVDGVLMHRRDDATEGVPV